MKEPFKYTTCGICGKKFIKPVGCIYHVEFAGRMFQCCSYHCYQQGLQVKENEVGKHYSNYLKEINKTNDEV